MKNNNINNIITIVTPSLNQGQFLDQAIERVLSQAGDFYVDYIIADGGSTDGSMEIIKKYDKELKSGKYPVKCKGIELRWWSRPDKGQANALNQGFKIAKGDICAWINSDDYYEEGALAFVMSKFRENPGVDLIYSNVYEIYDNGKILRGESGDSDFKKNLDHGCQISQQGAFFTKHVFKKVGYLDESFNYSFDYDLWLKILKSHKALFFDKHLAYFRFWPESKTCSQLKGFQREERKIRKKFGGSVINPMNIHRLRYKCEWTNSIKSNLPRFYNIFKKVSYKLANFIRYK